MFGLVQVVASTASSISGNVIGFGLEQVHWRTFFNGYAMFGVLLAILGFTFIRSRTPTAGFGSEGVSGFLKSVFRNIIEVGRMPHIILVSIMSATTFATWLSTGVVWARRHLESVHGFDVASANLGASLIFLGMAADPPSFPGCRTSRGNASR
jgi:MFS family permease